ncbi:MAG: hypothetical protein FWD61_20525 [Phycisphaerales bacterium]|nr:hypothetical protein [Phycisphaerales bacterium]
MKIKELWWQTFELFVTRPVLWVPCSIAAVLYFVLNRLQKIWNYWLAEFFATQHSVLGGTEPVAEPLKASFKAMWFISPLGFLKGFVVVCSFVTALFITKELVDMALDKQRLRMIAAARDIMPGCRGILLFSLKYLVAFGAGLLFTIFLMPTSPIMPERFDRITTSTEYTHVVILLMFACVAWLLMPSAIRLLRPQSSSKVSIEERTMGTIFAVVASEGSWALGYFVGKVEYSLELNSQWGWWAVSVLNTIVINLPQVILFIALALLAIQEPIIENLITPELELE